MSLALDNLTAAVAALSSAVTSATNEINVLAAQITTAAANDGPAIDNLVNQITAQTNALNNAVAAAAPAHATPTA